ncbi:hypothetical protein Psi02_42420 [Planotetraspora silvatica]|uniref:Uncharacterized protein n=1 Tax=Planotetraspora silvatica TaxID=234614 RepID=A0A8J3UL31_9ACTN|nr:hypothetical protein [Planotetraspora silvatica]GII47818.1 hypothetical protein Psi02_42420 [Planotetraspora silvatica]
MQIARSSPDHWRSVNKAIPCRTLPSDRHNLMPTGHQNTVVTETTYRKKIRLVLLRDLEKINCLSEA